MRKAVAILVALAVFAVAAYEDGTTCNRGARSRLA